MTGVNPLLMLPSAYDYSDSADVLLNHLKYSDLALQQSQYDCAFMMSTPEAERPQAGRKPWQRD